MLNVGHRAEISHIVSIRLGETHPKVMEYKNYLKYFGYLSMNDPVTETFDNQTEKATLKLQEQMALPLTGSLDETTLTVILEPRCAMPDADPIGAMGAGPWTKRQLTYNFGHLTAQLPPIDAANAVRRAFLIWQSASAGKLVFGEVSQYMPCDVRIEWRPASDSDRDMKGKLIAHGDFPPGYSLTTNTLPLPLHFNEEEARWGIGKNPLFYDISTIAIHEIGHCIGMLHSSSPQSIMFNRFYHNFALSTIPVNDIAVLRMLYP